jgi:nucleotide-binding universal stress UspA family protein
MRLVKILLPVDFSKYSAGAAQYAKALAYCFHSELTIAHVFQMQNLMFSGEAGMPPEWYEDMRNESQRLIQEFCADEFRNMPVRRLLLDGDVASMIVDLAHKEHMDLIVMPTHGYGKFRRFLLCAVDFDCAGEKALRWAAAFAAEFHSRLTVVHALPPIEVGQAHYFDQALPMRLREIAQERMGELQKKVGTTADVILDPGSVADMVRDAGTSQKADLVVIGRYQNPGLLGRLRTNAYQIVRESPCPGGERIRRREPCAPVYCPLLRRSKAPL